MKDQPPKLPERLFKLFCGNAYIDDLFGDLDELYHSKRSKHGRLASSIYYWYQSNRLLFSYAITKRKRSSAYSTHYQGQNNNMMLFNYIKISLRNIAKNKTFTFLNVLGLGLGMCIGLLALATFVDLKQFDRQHKDAGDIYRITTRIEENGAKNHYASAPPVLARLVDQQLTGIQQSVHINDRFFPMIQTAGDPLRLIGYITEPAFFDMFDFPLVAGAKEALEQPNVVVVSQKTANKLFGKIDVVGEQIETENWGTLQIGAVMAPFPKKTHFAFDILIGYQKDQIREVSNSNNWTEFGSNYYYFKTSANPSKVESQINNLSKNGLAFYEEKNLQASFELQSILSINPGKNLDDGIGVVYDRPGMYMFIGMALLILVPACLNYSNMAIANVLKRSKEIGVRKIMGSANRQIIHQFIVETVLICLMGLGLSILLFNLIRDELLSMLVGGTSMAFSLTPLLLGAFVLFAILTGIITGLVPALYFAKITPLNAIRRTFNSGKISISGMRKGLLVFQFVLSLGFMIGIGVLLKQYKVSLNYDQGFARDNVLVLPIDPENQQLIENTLGTLSAVTDMSFASSIPGTSLGSSMYFYSRNGLDSLGAYQVFVDNQYLEHMDISLAWGDDELRDNQIEQIIVNQTLMDKLANLREDKADSLLALLSETRQVQIVGVIQDYNHEPLNVRIAPMVLRKKEVALTYALVSINSTDVMATLEEIEASWKVILPDAPFKATFLDHEIEKAYSFFIIGLKIFGLMAALAISVSCLGLLGMVIYTTENRRKEVAIRKTLGANKWGLLYSLSGLFFRMWVIALIIGIPLSFIFYDKVLMGLYNKFSGGVGFSEVALSSLFTLGLGLLAIMVQSNKVMNTNPAENLRNE